MCRLRWRTSFRPPGSAIRRPAEQPCLVARGLLGRMARPAKGHGVCCIDVHGDRRTRRSSRRSWRTPRNHDGSSRGERLMTEGFAVKLKYLESIDLAPATREAEHIRAAILDWLPT